MRGGGILALLIQLAVGTLAATPTALAQSGLPQGKPTAAQIPASVRLNIVLGGQTRTATGQRWTKFEQFRDIPKKFTLTHLDFVFEKEGKPWRFAGLAQDATQLDQRYRLVLERYGRAHTEFRYDGYPNFISRLTVTPLTQLSPGVYALSATIRSSLQAAANSAVPVLVTDLVSHAPFGDLRLRRQRWQLRQEFILNKRWNAFFYFRHERRTGLKPIGLGTFERTQTASGGIFNVLGDELPEPVDYRTTEIRAGLTFHNARAMLRVEYGVSWFRNRIRALRWDNPFSLTDQEASVPDGAANRWRFATGQLNLYPNNTARTITLSGRVNLPATSFLSGLLSWGFWRQNDRFFPWTLNTAIVTGVPAGINPTNVASLPRQSLEGQINLLNSDVVFGTRKWKRLLLTSRYRVYRYNNETPQLPLPGYAAFGEAFWRSSIGPIPLTEFHQPNSFVRQQSSIEAVWKPVDQVQWKIEPFWEGWNRVHRQAARSNEWGANTQIIYQAVKWFNTRANYRYGSRRPELYVVGQREFSGLTAGVPLGGFLSGLRMFDQSHRNHHDAGIALNFGGKGPWSLSATYNYLGDRYDRNFFGLGTYLQGTVGVDLNYAPSDLYGFVAYYNHDRIRQHSRSIAKGLGAFTWTLNNEWDRDTRDKVDSLGVGFNASAHEQRLQFKVSYDFSLARQTITTQNPNVVRSDAVNDATAFPWPDIKSRFHELRLETSYRFRPNLEAGVRYLFEPYRLDDFVWDTMRPYMFGFEAPENDARRFLFLDSRYGNTNAHLVGIYVKYDF